MRLKSFLVHAMPNIRITHGPWSPCIHGNDIAWAVTCRHFAVAYAYHAIIHAWCVVPHACHVVAHGHHVILHIHHVIVCGHCVLLHGQCPIARSFVVSVVPYRLTQVTYLHGILLVMRVIKKMHID